MSQLARLGISFGLALAFLTAVNPAAADAPDSSDAFQYGGFNFRAYAQLSSPTQEGQYYITEVTISSTSSGHHVEVTGGLMQQVNVTYHMELGFDGGATPNNASKSASSTVIETNGITGSWVEWAELEDEVLPQTGSHLASASATISTSASSSDATTHHDHLFDFYSE